MLFRRFVFRKAEGMAKQVGAVALHSFTDFGLHVAANAALLFVIVGVSVGLERSPNTVPRPQVE